MTDELTTKEIDAIVLRVLATQSPDYLIHPDATAFMLEGLAPEEVEASLRRHFDHDHVGHFEDFEVEWKQDLEEDEEPVIVPKLDEDGKEITIDSGWQITHKGHATHAKHSKTKEK